MDRRGFLAAAAASAALPLAPLWAQTAAPRGTRLRVLSEAGPNSYDGFSPGLNRQSIQISWNIYDRLLRFGRRILPDGTVSYDYFKLEGELAESWDVSEDGLHITIALRAGASFHDGRPVRARDVKFSLDRVVASPIGRAQFATGSMTSPEQFVVIDDLHLRIDLPSPNRLALPNLALTYGVIVNSERALEHATPEDPFASNWLVGNPAGGGAYQIESAAQGERILLRRFEGWTSGPLPQIEQVLWQIVPQAETRIAALAKGDCDVMQDLAPKDVGRVAAMAGVKVAGAPTQAFQFIAMNTQKAPFDNVLLRRAIAAALPYEEMFDLALHGRGQPLWGGQRVAAGTSFPQPMGYVTDLARAKSLMAESGLGPLSLSFSYDAAQAQVAEPVALLLQAALAEIGLTVTLQKVPAGQLAGLLQQKAVDFYFEGSIAFLSDPDYFFRIFYDGDTRWNFGSYRNTEVSHLIEAARHERDPKAYSRDVLQLIDRAKSDLPILLLWHPTLDVAMRDEIGGYEFEFHRMLDLRPLAREA